ncbi:hypothetical protein ACWEF9_04285 [Streptomyces sp. NPDC004980]
MSAGSGNTYLAYAAARLAPLVVAVPLLTLPFTHAALTVLYVRRRAVRGPDGGAGIRAA